MNLPLAANIKQKRPSLKSSYLWNSLLAKWQHRFGRTDEAILNWVDLLKRDSTKSRFKLVRYLIEVQAFQEDKRLFGTSGK